MTTSSWSTRLRHDSDATFREWGSEFATMWATVGLVQAPDTGQINWSTVVRPGTNSLGGYEIWRFNDSQQATAPIFMRVEYRTGTGATVPVVNVTVGTGSNGSGTLTGTALTTSRQINGGTAQPGDTGRQSYMCCVDGFIGLNWKVGASASEGMLIICRTCDSTGAPTATGAMVCWGQGGANAINTQALRFASPAAAYAAQTSAVNTALGLNPQSPASTAVGVNVQAMMGWTITPQVAPLFGVCGVLDSEVAVGNTFATTLVGTVARTYVALSTVAGPFSDQNAGGSGLKFAMLWE